MKPFLITARTASTSVQFSALARSSSDAAALAVELLGDQVFGITVVAWVR